MKTIQHSKPPLIAAGILTAFVIAGCGRDDPVLTKAQQDAIRHPVAIPNHVGPTAADQEKMNQSIDAFRKKHEGDKIQFRGSG